MRNQRSLGWIGILLTLGGFTFGATRGEESFVAALPWLGWTALTFLLSTGRIPHSLGLGPGTLTLPLVTLSLGPFAAVLTASWARLFATFLDFYGERRRFDRKQSRSWGGSWAVWAVLVAGLTAQAFGDLSVRYGETDPLVTRGLHIAGWIIVLALAARYQGDRSLPYREPNTLGSSLLKFAVEAAGWTVGFALIPLAGHPRSLIMVLLGMGLLAAESYRQRWVIYSIHRRGANLQRLSRAGQRLSTEPGSIEEVVLRLARECRNAVSGDWFQLDLLAGLDRGSIWHMGPDGLLNEGPAPVPLQVPKRGFRRADSWATLQRELLAEGKDLATLRLWCNPLRLDPNAFNWLDQLAPQLSAALYRVLLERDAREDPLTGTALRRVLDDRLARAFQKSLEEGSSLAVVLVDLDHFKRVNDTWGHATGDDALKLAAEALKNQVRSPDLVARYGGEEFALVLEDSDSDNALYVAERVRTQIEATVLRVDEDRVPLYCSCGIASYPELWVASGSDLVELADEALYEAKRQGRNRSLIHRGRGRFEDAEGKVWSDESKKTSLSIPRL